MKYSVLFLSLWCVFLVSCSSMTFYEKDGNNIANTNLIARKVPDVVSFELWQAVVACISEENGFRLKSVKNSPDNNVYTLETDYKSNIINPVSGNVFENYRVKLKVKLDGDNNNALSVNIEAVSEIGPARTFYKNNYYIHDVLERSLNYRISALRNQDFLKRQ